MQKCNISHMQIANLLSFDTTRYAMLNLRQGRLNVIGWKEDIKVASGLAVGPNRVYVTDFHGNRVLMYDFSGALLKIFSDHFDNPTDIFIHQGRMYVANYGGGFVTVISLK